MSGYTKGPWTATQEMKNRWRITADAGEGMVPESLAIVTHTVLEMGSHGERTASNARLIAAAPELLAALHECEAYLADREDVVDGDYGQPAPNKEMTLLIEVRAAIRKARGES